MWKEKQKKRGRSSSLESGDGDMSVRKRERTTNGIARGPTTRQTIRKAAGTGPDLRMIQSQPSLPTRSPPTPGSQGIPFTAFLSAIPLTEEIMEQDPLDLIFAESKRRLLAHCTVLTSSFVTSQ